MYFGNTLPSAASLTCATWPPSALYFCSCSLTAFWPLSASAVLVSSARRPGSRNNPAATQKSSRARMTLDLLPGSGEWAGSLYSLGRGFEPGTDTLGDLDRFEPVVVHHPAADARQLSAGDGLLLEKELEAVSEGRPADVLDRRQDGQDVLEVGRLEVVAGGADARERQRLPLPVH